MTNDEITRMANQIWMAGETYIGPRIDNLARFAALVAAAEREACAKVCDHRKLITPEWILDQHYNQATVHCAKAIRARGQQ
jgi:hypothetical protein